MRRQGTGLLRAIIYHKMGLQSEAKNDLARATKLEPTLIREIHQQCNAWFPKLTNLKENSTMICDLDNLYRELAHSLDLTEGFDFSAASLPRPSDKLRTDRLVLRPAHHMYSTALTVAQAQISATKELCRELALLVLSVVFHTDLNSICLELLSPQSTIKQLTIQCSDYSCGLDYRVKPDTFYWWPDQEISNLTIVTDDFLDGRLPNIDFDLPSEPPFEDPTVTGFGNHIGNIVLADVLLNLSLPITNSNELRLEIPNSGHAGVCYRSAEIVIWLPGSVGYEVP